MSQQVYYPREVDVILEGEIVAKEQNVIFLEALHYILTLHACMFIYDAKKYIKE